MIPYLNFTQCLPSDVSTEACKAGADGEGKNETITVYGCGGVGASSIMEQTKGKNRTRGRGFSSIGSLWWRSYRKVELRLD